MIQRNFFKQVLALDKAKLLLIQKCSKICKTQVKCIKLYQNKRKNKIMGTGIKASAPNTKKTLFFNKSCIAINAGLTNLKITLRR